MKYLLTFLLLVLIPAQAKAFSTNDVFKSVNKARGAPLVRNRQLDLAAQMKAEALVTCSCFQHTLPGGRTFEYFIAQAGYKHQGAGEVLAKGFQSEKKLTAAWMKSPAHREVIMSGYRETGIGMATGYLNGTKTVFVVQLFASR
jgi:uncharacterized protein YkwD